MKIVCIPAFNVEKTIGDVVKECLLHVDKVIVCDDGSTDNTARIAKANGAEVVRHEKNYGYGAALITLFDKAREQNADIMITLDGDKQHFPEFIPRLIAPLSYESVDVVIGSRFLERVSNVPRYRKMGIKIITHATNMDNNIKLTDAQSGFRAYSKRAVQMIHPTEYGMAAGTEIIAKVVNKGLKIVEVPIVISYDGTESKKSAVPHGISVLMNVLKYMSVKHPIPSYGFPGIALIVIGSILGFQFLDVYLNTGVVFAGTLLGSVVTFLAGTILTMTAILLYTMATLFRENK
ncbi:MAG TPA: glycosyltransferase family 2 protein [Nitrosopumilaceae archaeon]|nr:glycosyltransferase family 2 protein [Nitrosopumilaceae archaeon]